VIPVLLLPDSKNVEEAFRNLKGDLAIRPVFHRDEKRIEAVDLERGIFYRRSASRPPKSTRRQRHTAAAACSLALTCP
jgi:hypothetical protein